MWDLAHQRCNYLICKCNDFSTVKNHPPCNGQMMGKLQTQICTTNVLVSPITMDQLFIYLFYF